MAMAEEQGRSRLGRGLAALIGDVGEEIGAIDRQFRAFDSSEGKILWQRGLPFAGHAAPSTYMVDGRQYVAIAAGGGGKLGTAAGDIFVAFTLASKR